MFAGAAVGLETHAPLVLGHLLPDLADTDLSHGNVADRLRTTMRTCESPGSGHPRSDRLA